MGYLVLSHPPGQPGQTFEAMVADLAAQEDWTLALKVFGLAVFVRGGAPPAVSPISGLAGVGGVLIGQAFDRAATERGEAASANLARLADLDPLDACRRLVAGTWGDYVAVLVPRRADPPTLLCPPMGALPAFAWVRDEVTLMGSSIPDGRAAPGGVTVDWDLLADILADPPRAGGAPPLRGLAWIPPGTMRHGEGARQLTTLWSPAAFARRRPGRPKAAGPELEAALVRTVDAVIAAQAAGAGPILCEVSGGLDSAIVATGLAALGHRPVRVTNFYRDQAEADERSYAQAVADRIGAPLATMGRPPMLMSQESLAFSARSAQPNFNAVDIDYDRLLAQEIADTEAEVLFTGHGGDVVFLQIGAAELAADLLRGEPCEGERLARLGDVARRTRRSVWSLAWQAASGRPGKGSPEQMVSRAAVARQRRPRGPGHPWMGDLAGVTPTKRLQIGGLVLSQRVFHETVRGDLVRQAHPLLGLPVVELSLSIPAPLLSWGEGERTLARRAFAHRLPASIVARRSKGDISVFFGKSMAASLGFLRPYLLEGRLMDQGLLDRETLEAVLDPDALIWRDDYGQILAAATLEAWVRHWEGRIAAGFAAAPGFGDASASPRNARARA